MQIIGETLVPYEVNLKNQISASKRTENILGIKPSLAYVNEQVLGLNGWLIRKLGLRSVNVGMEQRSFVEYLLKRLFITTNQFI